MKAAVYVGDPKTLAFEDLKPNPPGPRDVVVEIGASGVRPSGRWRRAR